MPAETLSSLLSLPRSAWADHPNYPDQTLLLKSHATFREISGALVRRAASGGDTAPISRMFRSWKSAMRGHEGYEEYKLYPYLSARWGLDFAVCEGGHRQLANVDAEVRAELEAPGPASAHLVDALTEHDAVLTAHLALEEELVIPALLALSWEEFEDYSMSDIRGLLQRLEGVTPGRPAPPPGPLSAQSPRRS